MSTELLNLEAATGGSVCVVRVTGPGGERMIELTALRDYDWPVRLTRLEAECVEEALRIARLGHE